MQPNNLPPNNPQPNNLAPNNLPPNNPQPNNLPPNNPPPNNLRPNTLPLVRQNKSKLLLWITIAVASLFLLVGAFVAYIFLVYLPNTPENRYQAGFGAVGDGMQYLIEESNLIDEISSTSYEGEVVFKNKDDEAAEDFSFKIKMNGEYDSQAASSKLTFYQGDDSSAESLGELESRFFAADGDKAPRLYFKIDNLSGEIQEFYDEFIEGSDLETDFVGTWWFLDFQKLIDEGYLGEDVDLDDLNLNEVVSQKDYEEVLVAWTTSLREYIFTDDATKMVFEMDEFLGEEEFKGSATHKYSVSINEDNNKAFEEDFLERFEKTEIGKKIAEAVEKLELESNEDEDEDDTIFEWDNYELTAWVDSETRVLRNFRFKDLAPGIGSYGNYTDFGVLIEDDVITFEVAVQTYSAASCWNALYFGDEEDADNDDCSYVLESEQEQESRLEDCEQDEEAADTSSDKSMLDANDSCYSERKVKSLKDDAQGSNYSMSMVLDTAENEVSFEMIFKDQAFEMRLTLKMVGQKEAADVEEPTDSQSILDVWDDLQGTTVYDEGAPASRVDSGRDDIAELRSRLIIYVSNNNGQLPTGSQSAADMDVFGEGTLLSDYSLADIFYFDSDFDSDDANEELAIEADFLLRDNVHIWAGHVCATTQPALYDDDPATAVTEGTSRNYAIVYIDNIISPTTSCIDNL